MFYFWWIFLIHLLILVVGDEGLYKSKDDVIILTNSSFPSSVLGAENAWLVEFYNSWCGHCVRFAPEYNKLATDIKGWQSVMSVGAVDCSQKHNVDLCREYDIKGYPSLVFFPPFASKEFRGKFLHDQDIKSIRRKAVDFVSNFTGVHKPASWPMLQPLSSVEHIWKEARDEHNHVILVFENKASYIGRQVILDLSQYRHLLIRTVHDKNIAKFGVTHLPSYFLLHGDGRYEAIAEDIDDRATLVKIIKNLIKADDQSQDFQAVQEETEKISSTKQQQSVTNGTVVYMQDLESALSYSFRQEIAIHKSIEDGALQALKDFIKVLSKYFPGEDYLMKFLWRVKVWIETITSGLTGEVWVYYIYSLQTVDTYLPETINWVGCKGSDSKYRGYPCSMWTLFHTLTANAYRVGKDSPKFLYAEVLNAVTDYMKYFFGCETCSKHFLNMADKRHITSAEDQVMWLWSAHNQANQRLHGDQSEDPLHPKILFPSVKACPKCRKGNEEGGDNPVWDEPNVLEFIVKMYSKENIVRQKQNAIVSMETKEHKSSQEKSQTGLDWWERMQREKDLKKIKEIRKMKKQRLEDKLRESGQLMPVSNNKKVKLKTRELHVNASIISNGDMNMCVLFYGLCLVIIALLYYYFVRKRRMNPCNGFKNSKPLV